MSKKGPREIVFVCAAVKNGELISKIISAACQNDALKFFKDEFQINVEQVYGPFHKKRSQVIETTRELKFANETKKAIYNEWHVNAYMLKEPENQAFLVFTKRIDGKKMPSPKGTITVPISELRYI